MARSIPGTVMQMTEETGGLTPDTIMPFLNLTGGLTLSQVCEITGLEPATIQNWVKRGFVSSPISKKYSKEQISRILIINSLRDSMQLDRIALLLSYINGCLIDTSDDIISDSELYRHFCRITLEIASIDTTKRTVILQNIKEAFKNYQGTEKERLERTLLIMILVYQATVMKRKATELMSEIEAEEV